MTSLNDPTKSYFHPQTLTNANLKSTLLSMFNAIIQTKDF